MLGLFIEIGPYIELNDSGKYGEIFETNLNADFRFCTIFYIPFGILGALSGYGRRLSRHDYLHTAGNSL